MGIDADTAAFKSLIEAAIINLNITIDEMGRVPHTTKQNAILHKFIKSRSSLSQFSKLKKELRQLMNITGSKDGNAQAELYRLITNDRLLSDTSDLAMLVDLSEMLKTRGKYNTSVFKVQGNVLKDTIYMFQDQVNAAFSESKEQSAEFKIYVSTGEKTLTSDVVEFITEHGHFKIVRIEQEKSGVDSITVLSKRVVQKIEQASILHLKK